MNKAILALGIVAVAIPLYDQVALPVNTAISNAGSGVQLPFVWQGPVTQFVSEAWLAIIGAILILIAAFIPLG